MLAGEIAEGKAHFDQAIALYDPAEHRPLGARFGPDLGVLALFVGRLRYGCLVIPRPRLLMQIVRSRTRARSVMPHL